MGSGHSHGPVQDRLRATGRLRLGLTVLVVLIGVLTLAAGAWTWPRGPVAGAADVPQVRQDDLAAQVVTVRRQQCAGTAEDRTATGRIPASVACATVSVRLLDGDDAGQVVDVQVAGPVVDQGLAPGVRAVIARYPDADGAPDAPAGAQQSSVYAWVDFDRGQPMLVLTAVFVLVVLLIARWRGLAALGGVVTGFVMVTWFLLPALRRGEDPAVVTFVGCTAVMLVVLYASHGVSAKTTSAFLGTLCALAVTAGLSVWATNAAYLNGQTGEDALSLSMLVGAETIRAAVVSGLVLAGLGVLNDVTVTQASSVWELRAAAPHLDARALFSRGMRIGRDHLVSTVYTIAFAYAGLALPVLLLIQVYDRPLSAVITSSAIAHDVVGVLVSGIGLSLAIPLTTAIAALIAHACDVATEPGRPPTRSDQGDHHVGAEPRESLSRRPGRHSGVDDVDDDAWPARRG